MVARKHYMKDDVYNRVHPCGSRAGIMYGLPKIHKDGCPIRPIISSVNTYNYKLAKYMVEILSYLVEDNSYMLVDTFDFVNKISKLDVNVDKQMVSFDVESLFTNIPVNETIEIILQRVFTDNIEFFHDLNKDQLKKLLEICTSRSHFQFNGQFYDQIDGVSMGSPLAPLFANIFMSELEKKNMDKLRDMGVNIWLRYVDDIFATLSETAKVKDIMGLLNNLHPNIKFTVENEDRGKLPFFRHKSHSCRK